MTLADPRKERSASTPSPASPLDRGLDVWLSRSQTFSKIVWNLVAVILALGLAGAALGLIDWSPAFVAVLPERAHDLVKLLRRAAGP